jgi:hypothetical protein
MICGCHKGHEGLRHLLIKVWLPKGKQDERMVVVRDAKEWFRLMGM